MAEKWLDLYHDGRRINRIIRYLETLLKKAKDDDKIIKYANSICYLTSQKMAIVDKVTGISEYLANLKKEKGL